MAGKRKSAPGFPTQQQILEFIRESPTPVGRREIARAFNIKGNDRIELKRVVRKLAEDGHIDRGRGRKVARPGSLPEVSVVVIRDINSDGEPVAYPQSWGKDDGPEPSIIIMPEKGKGSASGIGDRLLVRVSRVSEREYEGRVIRKLEKTQQRIIGVFETVRGGGRISSTDKKNTRDYEVLEQDIGGAKTGDLVAAVTMPKDRQGLRRAKVVERFGKADDVRAISLIAMREQDIPYEFPDAVLKDADKARPVRLGKRTDLREVPLVTIDGADARDFDDAVYARPDDDPNNKGGWRIIVAIADVAHYVRPGSPLDREAYRRGNSCYFPDRVSPMLPEKLSNGLCSLKPDVQRACLTVEMVIGSDGNKRDHRFMRGLMKSWARLTYEEVQEAHDNGLTLGLPDETFPSLYGAFKALDKARQERGALDLDLPELRINIGDDGEVANIAPRQRLDSHKLIEEFMVLANVAAAETLEQKHLPCMYRAHEPPALTKIEALRENLESMDLPLARGNAMRASDFNTLLAKVRDTTHERMVNELVLRSQSQAVYAPENPGHFGLALRKYAHFTSPIRRYSDLIVHRALIDAHGFGNDGLPDGAAADMDEWGEHISATERRAVVAERNAIDRYCARYLADRVGAHFDGRIAGVTRFGLFVTLDETGADGLIPIRSLPDDWYDHDDVRHTLSGRSHGNVYALGDIVEVRLEEAVPVTGGLTFSLVSGGRKGRPVRLARSSRHAPKGGKRNKPGKRGRR